MQYLIVPWGSFFEIIDNWHGHRYVAVMNDFGELVEINIGSTLSFISY